MIGRIFKVLFGLTFLVVLGVAVAGFLTYKRLEPNLPDIDSLSEVQLHVPLLVYTSDSKLIAEYGEKRRERLRIEDTPQVLIDAVLSAEDDRFYEHPGVDYQGLMRAGINLLKTGKKGQGGSTITMQVARNVYLSPEKTYLRKINEILLALKIERQISKDDILELYLNLIFMGNRAYGAASAAKVYYGKDVSQIGLAEAAMIAGLPKAPSAYNPVVNPQRALVRRNYVLRRMLELRKITGAQYREALEKPVSAMLHRAKSEVEAAYISEMARAQMVTWFGSEAYTGGYKVVTTVDSKHQNVATDALRTALQKYEKRHGLRILGNKANAEDVQSQENIDELLATLPAYGGVVPALVLEISRLDVTAVISGGEQITVPWEHMEWASPRREDDKEKPEFTEPGQILKPLDLIHVIETGDAQGNYALTQMPAVEGALVSLAPDSGRIMALVGGFDFYRSKFNRVVQAYRQPGSNFKPFIYSAALENGNTPASIYNDTPVVLEDSVLESEWRPENYSGRFFGPTRLREALVKSRNLVSIRVLREMGLPRARRYARQFGFDERSLPNNLSLALGSGDLTPLQLARAYTVFANGGYSITPYFIERVLDADGNIVFEAPEVQFCDTETECAALQEQLNPTPEAKLLVSNVSALDVDADVATAETEDSEPVDEPPTVSGLKLPEESKELIYPPSIVAPRVIDRRNAFIMRSMMREVVRRGTATRAKVLGRADIGGKTGTTNDLFDAWFTGFNSALVSTAWVGYDDQKSLGPRENGGVAALPMWIDYMRVALDGVPEDQDFQPDGISMVRIDRKTGKSSLPGDENAFFEYFRDENVPEPPAQSVEARVPDRVPARVPAQNSSVRNEPAKVIGNGQQQGGAVPEVVVRPVPAQQPRQIVTPESKRKKVEQLF